MTVIKIIKAAIDAQVPTQDAELTVTPSESALLSEAALAEDWSRPEEDAAWSHFQPARHSSTSEQGT